MEDWEAFATDRAPVYTWSTEKFFDDQVRDDYNLNLSENLHSFLSGIFTAAAILFLTDIVFRIAVHAREHIVEADDIVRTSLFTRVVNPLYWISFLPRPMGTIKELRDRNELSHCVEKDTIFGDKQPAAQQLHSAQRCEHLLRNPFLICAGLLLISLDILLIFLATARNSPVPIDKTKIPTFTHRNATPDAIVLPHTYICSGTPIVSREGFQSRANTEYCVVYFSFINKDLPTPGDYMEIYFIRTPGALIAEATRGQLVSGVQLTLSVGLDDGSRFITDPKLDKFRFFTAVEKVFVKRNIQVISRSNGTDIDDWPLPNWGYTWSIKAKNMKVPRNVFTTLLFLDKGVEEPDVIVEEAQNAYVLGAALATLTVSGQSRAYQDGLSGMDFEMTNEPLVINQRPWLNLTACITLTFILFIVWFIIAVLLGLEGGVDYYEFWISRKDGNKSTSSAETNSRNTSK